jgi:hypothetical protein
MTRHILLTLLAATLPAASAFGAGPSGRWIGAIETPQGGLAIAVTLLSDSGSAWSGTIDIPGQRIGGRPLDQVTVEGERVHFEIAGLPGVPTFDGELDQSGDRLAGSFRQGGQELTFSLDRAPAGAAALPDLAVPAAPVPGTGMAGDWIGVLDAGVELRLVLRARVDDEGRLSAKLESLDQGMVLAVDKVELAENELTFSNVALGATFEGTLVDDGSAISGTWSQAGNQLPLTLHRMSSARRERH